MTVVSRPDLQRRELLRAHCELLASLEGLRCPARSEVLEDEQHDGERGRPPHADLAVAECDARGEQAGRELRRQHRQVNRADALATYDVPMRGALKRGHDREVEEVRDHEDDEHERARSSRPSLLPGAARRRRVDLDQHAADEREDRVVRDVVDQRGPSERRATQRVDGGRSRRRSARRAPDRAAPSRGRSRGTSPRCGRSRTSTVSTSLPIARTSSRPNELRRLPVGCVGDERGRSDAATAKAASNCAARMSP